MWISNFLSRGRILAVSLGSALAVTAAATTPVQVDASSAQALLGKHRQVLAGLDNPRQLSRTPNGDLLVAQAGHGSSNPDNCFKDPEFGVVCVGKSGSVIRLHRGNANEVMKGMLSFASRDGSDATGSDGAGKRPGGGYYSVITYAPHSVIPQGLPAWQSGKLLARPAHGGKLHAVANITAYERRHDPDGEGFDSNPYSLLALRHQVLVADAAGNDILRVRGGKVSLWDSLPNYGEDDAVPTVVTKGADGNVYVGELHSFVPGAARVWKYNRQGRVLRSWRNFTTVTGVARGGDGSLYVSELFGGKCTFDQIPTCFPGRVVRIAPDGDRSYRRVPFPAGIAVTHGRVYVAAFSTSPSSGFGGNPDWSGAVWRIFRR
ncbi:MAG: ScyD/ScyE family protein [Propionibacteriales bacterium]|nr:ScyD/ScyE family protein [Propionibacteriales bacterium]